MFSKMDQTKLFLDRFLFITGPSVRVDGPPDHSTESHSICWVKESNKVSEYADGGDLVSLYKRRGSFTPDELGFYAAEILLGITGLALKVFFVLIQLKPKIEVKISPN